MSGFGWGENGEREEDDGNVEKPSVIIEENGERIGGFAILTGPGARYNKDDPETLGDEIIELAEDTVRVVAGVAWLGIQGGRALAEKAADLVNRER